MFSIQGRHRRGLRLLAALVLGGVAMLVWAPAHAARLALVIGNAAYTDSPLKNPVNDARDMAAKLSSLGFRVDKVENLKRNQIGRTLSGFASRVQAGDEVVVFYAGHGLQVKGVNYLPAVDAEIQTEEDVPLNSMSLNVLMDRLEEAKAGVKLVFLDACRNNPFARSFRGGSRGLARVEGAPSGTLILFATRPGSVAADGDGRNGLYTSQLLKFIGTPGLSVESLHKRVAVAVDEASRGAQEPWVEGSLKGEFYFGASAAPVSSVPAPALPTLATPPVPALAVSGGRPNEEQQVWEVAQRLNTPGAYQAYLAQYPKGRYARVARVMVEGLPAVVAPASAPAVPRSAEPLNLSVGQTERECVQELCFEMAAIPAGQFQMGIPSTDQDRDSNESPERKVSVRAFWLGKTEVTRALWKAVMETEPAASSDCTADCPVQNVSWDEAQTFVQNLSTITGKPYRLPSEAEWEYAARAGSQTPWSFGGDESELRQYAWYLLNSLGQAHAVASLKPNAWGLFDMYGNVWEWVQDEWHGSYRGAPLDGSAWESGSRGSRVMRGGGWISLPRAARSGYRDDESPTNRGYTIGFRLARTAQ